MTATSAGAPEGGHGISCDQSAGKVPVVSDGEATLRGSQPRICRLGRRTLSERKTAPPWASRCARRLISYWLFCATDDAKHRMVEVEPRDEMNPVEGGCSSGWVGIGGAGARVFDGEGQRARWAKGRGGSSANKFSAAD